MSSIPKTFTLLIAFLVGLVSCTGEVGVFEEDQELTSDADPEPSEGQYGAYSVTSLANGTTATVCNCKSGLNHRSGPSTSYMILRVLSPGSKGTIVDRSGSWYKVSVGGNLGWSFGYYLCASTGSSSTGSSSTGSSSTGSSSTGSSSTGASGFGVSRDGIINASKAFLGFSYWWGGAAFKIGSTSYGHCSSSTYGGHSGSYGADCSGFVGKAWQVPGAMPFEQNLHPYSTYHFQNQKNYWTSISRSSATRADAMVYNSSGSGHILIYESGDAWGYAWTYESRGCSYGVVHNNRSIGSSYVARERDGV